MGLASLAAAARLNELGVKDIGIYTTAYGGTPYIAAINFVLPDNPYGDTIGQYNDDMIHAGYGINNKTLVQDMAASTMEGYKLLRRWGVEFAKNEDGTTKLRHLSGPYISQVPVLYHRAYWSGDCKEAGRWPGRKRDSGPYGI